MAKAAKRMKEKKVAILAKFEHKYGKVEEPEVVEEVVVKPKSTKKKKTKKEVEPAIETGTVSNVEIVPEEDDE